MPNYLVIYRRSRSAFTPVSGGDNYILNASSKVTLARPLLPDIDLAAAVIAVAPVTGAFGPVQMVAPPTMSTVVAYYPLIGTATITIASPGVLTCNAHGRANGDRVRLSTTGALPTGLAVNTDYFVVNAAANTLRLSTVSGGSAITTTGTQSGVHSLYYRA